MFSARKAYYEGMEHRSNELRVQDGARRQERQEDIDLGEGMGSLAVRRSVSVHAYRHLSPDATMHFEPPHPEYGSQATFHEYGNLGDYNGRTVADRLVEQLERAAQSHDAHINSLVEAAAAQAQAAPAA